MIPLLWSIIGRERERERGGGGGHVCGQTIMIPPLWSIIGRFLISPE
jgi:hypothetical protein